MCKFYSTSDFRKSLNLLIKKPKEGYSSVKNDICDALCKHNHNDILQFYDWMRDEKNFRIVKLRLPNSGQNLSKANGFRLIYLIHKEKKSIILLDIYPKRGNHKKNSIDKAEINRLLANYVNEGESLQLHNINSELLEMVEA